MVDLVFGVLATPRDPAAEVFERLRLSLCRATPPVASGCSVADSGPCRLGVVRRSTTGQPAAPPIIRGTGGALLAGDLRLVGTAAHAAALGLDPKASDGEFALAAARDDPRRFPRRLTGDFALAAWLPGRAGLLLARDRIGVRPLFHARLPGGGIAFASLPGALVEAGCAAAVTDAREMVRWLCGPAPAGPRTHLRDIARVPAGHVLQVSGGRERCTRYWRLATRPTIAPTSQDEVATGLRQRLERAVARCIPGEGPVATLLSGGLDSTAVAALAARLTADSGRETTGFCRVTPRGRAHLGAPDQGPLAASAARRAGITLRLVPTDFIASALDGPAVPGVSFAGDLRGGDGQILGAAAALGTDRILCGLGGDEGASAYGDGRYADALARGLVAACAAAVIRDAGREGARAFRRLAVEAMRAVLPRGPLAAVLSRLGRPGYRHACAQFLSPQARHLLPAPMFRTDGPRAFLESNHYQGGLEARAIKAAEHGLRYVYPLLDPDLLDFTARLPALFWVLDGIARWPIRAATADLLPDGVRLATDKMLDDGTEALWLAENRARLAAGARALGRLPEVAQVFDMDAVARDIAQVPPPAEVARRIRACAAQGRQSDAPLPPGWVALFNARFIASGGGMRPLPATPAQPDA